MSCICFSIIVVYLLFLPPLLLSGSPDDRCRCPVFDYVVDDHTPLLSSFQASSAPSYLPDIAYVSVLFYCTKHMLLRYNPIQLHSLSLSPLVIPFRYLMLP